MKIRVPRAVGALAAQVTQAMGSFALQILAARELGAAGFGVFAFMFGAMIMATSLSTGLIGDSLTVLDRHDPTIRAALWRLTLITVSLVACICLVGAFTTGLDPETAVVFAIAVTCFMTADLLRRLLMASMRFWSLVVVDSVAITASLSFIGVTMLVSSPDVLHFAAAIAIGQATACLIAMLRLPQNERYMARRQWGAWRTVIGFGAWRAAQQFVRPTMLNAARWVVLVAAGQAAVGELEAARVFVAPAMLFIQGIGSYLFASYAADKSLRSEILLRRADRAALTMLGGAVLIGLAAAAAIPAAGHFVTDGQFDLSLIAVAGWACYAASCAAVLPYGSLAAVGGQQRAVLILRLVDALVSVLAAAAAIILVGISTDWTPWLLSMGSFAGGILCRQIILARRPEPPLPSDHRQVFEGGTR